MTRSVGKVDNICRKYSYKIDKSHGASYMPPYCNKEANKVDSEVTKDIIAALFLNQVVHHGGLPVALHVHKHGPPTSTPSS